MRERKKLRCSLAAFQILLQTNISWWRYVCKPSLMILFHFHFMAACSEHYLDHPLLRLAKPKMGKSSWLSQSDPEVNTNSTGSVSEGKGMRERMLRGRWMRSQLDGGRDTPRVSSPSYPSGWQGTLLPSITTHTHTSIFGQKGGGKEKFASQRCRLHLLPHRWLDQLHNVESL